MLFIQNSFIPIEFLQKPNLKLVRAPIQVFSVGLFVTQTIEQRFDDTERED